MTGLLLGDGTLRKQGHNSLLAIQQTDEALVNLLWSICNKYKLVNKKVQSFNFFYDEWYKIDIINNSRKKVLPLDLETSLTPLAIAHWTMGDGTFDKGKAQCIILCTDCFSLTEVDYLRSILLKKYTIDSAPGSLRLGSPGWIIPMAKPWGRFLHKIIKEWER